MTNEETDSTPQLHPLARSLGPTWRWLRDARGFHDNTIIILHPDGLWTEFARSSLWTDAGTPSDAEWVAIALALVAARASGTTGYRMVEVTVRPEQPATARVVTP